MTLPAIRCDRTELVGAYALQALSPSESAEIEAHVASCPHCRRELDQLREAIDSLDAWPTDVLRPRASLQARLASRISGKTGETPVVQRWREPEWDEVAPGIFCKLLANDAERNRLSMLVRLMPGVNYPPHTHAGVEELHLLDGELWIDERKLRPGDYNRGDPGASDQRVWSETGCTCVLITSTKDVLR